MNVLPVIPARAGSKGIPHKNTLVRIGGLTLVEHALRCLNDVKTLPPFVTTNDEIAAEQANAWGDKYKKTVVILDRPAKLCQDDTPMIDVVQNALAAAREAVTGKIHAVLLLQPSSPFRDQLDITTCLDEMATGRWTSITSYVDVGERHPERMVWADTLMEVILTKSLNRRRQDLRQVLLRDGAIYLTRTDVIDKGDFYGDYPHAYVRHWSDSWNIDEPEDVALAKFLFHRNRLDANSSRDREYA